MDSSLKTHSARVRLEKALSYEAEDYNIKEREHAKLSFEIEAAEGFLSQARRRLQEVEMELWNI